MNLASTIVLLFILLDCVTKEISLALKGFHVPLTAFGQPVKALLTNKEAWVVYYTLIKQFPLPILRFYI